MTKSVLLGAAFLQFITAAGKPGGVAPNPAAPPEVRILSEVQPAGGTVQIKFALTEPRPISTGTTSTFLDAGAFDDIYGVELFSSTGDVFGTALVRGTALSVNYTSLNGTFGTSAEYPVLTIAAHIRDNAPKGHVVQLGTGVSLAGSYGAQPYAFVLKPGTLTIGGTVSINNVVPGGGLWPAGTRVHVTGQGFQAGTSVRATVKISAVSVVSSHEIDFTLAETAVLDGQRIDMKNPDGSSDSYYSYLRGVPQGTSSNSLLNATLPIFSTMTYSKAMLVQNSAGIKNSILTALAIQNPGDVHASVQLEAFSAFGASIGKVQIVLPARGRIVRELGEYFGQSLQANSTVRASSDSPVQFLGISADQVAGTATAFAAGR